MRRALNANVRLGTPEAVARLERVARDTATPSELRVEAIAALGVWGEPSPMDRVDGYYHMQVTVAAGPSLAARRQSGRKSRGADARGSAGEPRVVLAGAGQAATKKPVPKAPATRPRRRGGACGDRTAGRRDQDAGQADVDVKVALAEAAGRLDARAVAPVLEAQLKSDPSVLVRTASLRGLQEMKAGDMGALMETALADKDPLVRRAALALLPGLPIPAAAKVQHLERS